MERKGKARKDLRHESLLLHACELSGRGRHDVVGGGDVCTLRPVVVSSVSVDFDLGVAIATALGRRAGGAREREREELWIATP